MVLISQDLCTAYEIAESITPLRNMLGPKLPVEFLMVLLPYKGRIVFSGSVERHTVVCDRANLRTLNEAFDAAVQHRLVVALDGTGAGTHVGGATSVSRTAIAPSFVKKQMIERGEAADVVEIRDMIEMFCREMLDEEYADLTVRLLVKFASRCPKKLATGGAESWACGLLRVVGYVNFLDDPELKCHLPFSEIDHAFAVTPTIGKSRMREIRKGLDIERFDPEFSTREALTANPIVWMMEVNGLLVDGERCRGRFKSTHFRTA